MDDFRDLFAEADATIAEHLGDHITIADRDPVRGFFAAPAVAAKLGRIKANLLDPRMELREADAAGITKGMTVKVEGQPGMYKVVELPAPDGAGWTMIVLRKEA